MLFYRAALPLSHQTLTFAAGLIRTHRHQIGSVWRALSPGQQALLVLVYLRKGEPFAEIGAGFGMSTTTSWRYVNETVELLAQRAPTLREALREAKRQGMASVIIDGTLIVKRPRRLVNPIGRPAAAAASLTTPDHAARLRSWSSRCRPRQARRGSSAIPAAKESAASAQRRALAVACVGSHTTR